MATTEQYLTQLQADKEALVTNLTEKGVTASSDETFTSLVPKVLDIQSGGGAEEYFNMTPSGTLTLGNIIKTIPQVDMTNVTSMQNAFKDSQIETIPQLDTSNVTNISSMAYFCTKLTTIPQLDASNIKSMSNAFYGASALENFGGLLNLGKAFTNQSENSYKLDLSLNSKLTHESLMNVINGLYDLNLTYDVANGGTLYKQNLKLGATNLAKLTEEEIAIATNKGWNVT